MAVDEHSFWVFYGANLRTTRRITPPQFVKITQMWRPWRRGHAVMLPYWSGRSIALGIWFRHVVKNLPDYMVDDQWLSPKLVPTTIDEIAEWDPIDEEEDVQAAEENESGAPRQTDREGEDTGDTGSLRGTGDVEWDLDELPSPLPPAG